MNTHFNALEAANRLPHVLHWALGVLACIVGMALENPGGVAHFGMLTLAVAVALGGLVFSIVSRLAMLLCPWPYAWLHRVLNRHPGSAS